MNHFPRCCRSKPIRPLFAESSSLRPREIRHVTHTQQYPTSDDEYIFTVAISQVSDLRWLPTVLIVQHTIVFKTIILTSCKV
jgi:hypothetical protein